MPSLTHIYFGDGKGKTTAALGLALRANGAGKKVVIVQFLKDWQSSELKSLELLPTIKVFRGKSSGSVFIKDMTEEQIAETKKIHDDNLNVALDLHKAGECDVLVLDEAIDAYQLDVLDHGLFEDLINNKPDDLELVITGHKPDRELFQNADYITEMVKRRHPYDKGIQGRKGIEF